MGVSEVLFQSSSTPRFIPRDFSSSSSISKSIDVVCVMGRGDSERSEYNRGRRRCYKSGIYLTGAGKRRGDGGCSSIGFRFYGGRQKKDVLPIHLCANFGFENFSLPSADICIFRYHISERGELNIQENRKRKQLYQQAHCRDK